MGSYVNSYELVCGLICVCLKVPDSPAGAERILRATSHGLVAGQLNSSEPPERTLSALYAFRPAVGDF